MQWGFSIGLCVFSVASVARAQERKIEISPFAGGYFTAGDQHTSSRLTFLTGNGSVMGLGGLAAPPNTEGEPNSGIFGVRASHALTQSLTLEGTFGFSPAGPRFQSSGFTFTSIAVFLQESVPAPLPVHNGNTFHYTANILYKFYNRGGWSPFFTAGAGAVTRTRSKRLSNSPTLGIAPDGSVTVDVVEPQTQTNPSLNVGGGVKKYLGDRYGIRFDFRSYISQPNGDTINNMELSFGLIFRL